MKEIYKDPSQTVDDRVDDLLSRMTLEEKVGQMMQLNAVLADEDAILEMHIGSFLHAIGEKTAVLQRIAVEDTRLGIPIIFGIDAIHGHSFRPGATIFPTQLGMSSSWNTALAERAARVTAREMSYTGTHWTFSPVLCVARDLRWGRINETFGEDPLLIGDLACAMIKGYQGDSIAERESVLACAKHFIGYSETHGGLDANEADHSERKIRMLFLEPFLRAANIGCATFMIGYQAIDGVPCSANPWLLKDLLRDEMEFEGIAVTDYNNVGHMVTQQFTCAAIREASEAALHAGNDMIMQAPEFFDAAISAVSAGKISEITIDTACERILRKKFEMGLFEDPRYADEELAATVIGCPDHREAALQAAKESIVLLKNDDEILPLDESMTSRVALVGPAADDTMCLLGDWALGTGQLAKDEPLHPRESCVTLRDGLERILGDPGRLIYEKGCSITVDDEHNIPAAVTAAKEADVVILAVGDHLPFWGEEKSTATLELMGHQQELLEAIRKTGKPMIVVVMNSKPLAVSWIAENADAVIEAWNPGMEGGNALAEILFGHVNPCGKLSISIPRHVGQTPVVYSQFPGRHGENYADLPAGPLYEFGFGLSYTSYEYSDLSVKSDQLRKDDDLSVTVTVENTGKQTGTEIVQLYIRDKVTSATWPMKLLKAYQRVQLEPGESKEVTLTVPYDSLAIVTSDCRRIVEPGEFDVMVGPSSDSETLLNAQFSI